MIEILMAVLIGVWYVYSAAKVGKSPIKWGIIGCLGAFALNFILSFLGMQMVISSSERTVTAYGSFLNIGVEAPFHVLLVTFALTTLIMVFSSRALLGGTRAGQAEPVKMRRAKEFTCPECGQPIKVSWIDGVAKTCPSCRKSVRIPEVPVSSETDTA